MNDLRTAAQQALAALEYHTEQTRPIQRTADAIATLRAALAEDARDWSLLEATQESLREHMAEIQRLRAAPATIAEWWAAKQAASGEPDMRHPKIQALIGSNARRNIEMQLVEQLLDDPDCELTSMDMEYWHGLHDKLREKLTAAAQPAPARAPSSVNPEAHADFVRALHGGKGDLDAWLECYNEAEVRAHVLALIQPAASGEPVAQVLDGAWNTTYIAWLAKWKPPAGMPLYATPQPAPARVPLTDEQIDRITAEQWGRGLGAPYAAYRAYARAVEAAHGIAAPGAPDALEGTP